MPYVEIDRDDNDIKIVLPFVLMAYNSEKVEDFIDNELPKIVEFQANIIVDDLSFSVEGKKLCFI